ncbi:unnamed protein product [Gongylonema pulchrum]|uniref:Secreted protein n=1 Tax=Gongylonema pulchrum TaxID=637853 RepID=A0A183E0F7_9BILA|nr:unnamed protein product [Gongylonema pulchrum]
MDGCVRMIAAHVVWISLKVVAVAAAGPRSITSCSHSAKHQQMRAAQRTDRPPVMAGDDECPSAIEELQHEEEVRYGMRTEGAMPREQQRIISSIHSSRQTPIIDCPFRTHQQQQQQKQQPEIVLRPMCCCCSSSKRLYYKRLNLSIVR